MIALAAAVFLVGFGCAVLFPRWQRGRGGSHFMLAALPTVTAVEYARTDRAARSAEELTLTTSTIATGLIFTVVLGASLATLLVLVSVSNILFVTTRRTTDRFRTFAWAVYAVVAVGAAWNALRLSVDARWIQFAVR